MIALVIVAFAAIGMASATWPMAQGTVQLSEISFEELKAMQNSLDMQGIPGNLAAFLELSEDERGGLGKQAKKAAFVGSSVPGR